MPAIRGQQLAVKAVFAIEVKEPMAVNSALVPVQNQDHENVSVLRVYEHVLEATRGLAPGIINNSI
jgi:hypothetical protein